MENVIVIMPDNAEMKTDRFDRTEFEELGRSLKGISTELQGQLAEVRRIKKVVESLKRAVFGDSRQVQYQHKHKAEKICRHCSSAVVEGSVLCAKHLIKCRELARRRTGCNPWKPGGLGRPALAVADPAISGSNQ